MRRLGVICLVTVGTLCGCGAEKSPAPASSPPPQSSVSETSRAESRTEEAPPKRKLSAPVQLESLSGNSSEKSATGPQPGADAESGSLSWDEQVAELQPLQIMLGTWRSTTQREFGQFKATDQPVWVWDLKSDPKHPALVMKGDKSPYFRELRMTSRGEPGAYRMTAIDADGASHEFGGNFSSPVEEIIGDDKKTHRVYKLELTEGDGSGGEQWQVLLNQQDNNRYLMELSKRRGTAKFQRVDTVAHQREGTSFALNDSDYKEKTCVISGGLGTTQVSYGGKSYWVCCSGCQAAFNEDPQKWITRYEAKQKEK